MVNHRIALHWETHVWLKNLLVMETVPDQMVTRLLLLCTHRYSEVRVAAQELLIKAGVNILPQKNLLTS